MRTLSLAVITAAIAFAVGGPTLHSQAGSPCGAGINPTVCENQQPGDPASDWDITGSGDATIQGFATDISVDQGGVVQFKVKTDAAAYHLDIYRMGYYGGMGARKVATINPSVSLPQTQPACLTQAATGLVDCGNWAVSASWTVPATAVSGIYFAKAVRTDTGGASHIVFVVRDDDGNSDLLFQTSDTTWTAYNTYGGNSLYVGQPAGRAYKVSYNRPFINRGTSSGGVEGWLFSNQYPMVRWLESNGYNVSYTTGVDTERRGLELREHKVFLSVGHDEYWSAGQRANVEAARDAGINIAFFSGNESFWKTRWENSIDGTNTANRTLVSYKETHDNAKTDPNAAWTGTWRDPRFSPPADGGRPENSMTGTLFMVNGTRNDPMSVPQAMGTHRFWRNTSVATLAPGQTANFGAGLLGYEWDEAPDNGVQPPGLQRLSSTTINVNPLYLQDYGTIFGAGIATHSMTLYRAASGALVFGAGTVQYSWGLDATHDRVGPAADVRLQQATVNLFADMGVQPGSIQAGLAPATPSSDTTAPVSTITSPANGATVQSGTPVTITGTSSDTGGVVTNVEVSTDGGATWTHATGTQSWSFSWTPSGPGSANTTANFRVRGYDDSGNRETAGGGNTVTILPIGGLTASYGFNEGSGSVAADISGNGNNGTLSGATWSTGKAGGGLLFNGVDNWVTINDVAALHLTTGVTLEAWVNPSSLTGWRSVILKEAPPNTLAYSLYANDNVPRPATTIRVPAGDLSAAGTSGLPLNSWTHIAGTYDGTTIRTYVNGVEVASTPATGNMVSSTAPLRIGGNAIWGEYFSGLIDEVRVYRRALAPSEIQADMNVPVGGGPLPDTTLPTVSVTAPAAGAVVSGTAVTVTAAASDNVGVVGVQFLLDGASLGAEDLTSPYSVSWNTTTGSDGSHVLSARARDAAGNLGTATNVTVTVNNTPDSVPPTVSITAPASGATLTGTATVSMNAADNVAVAGVSFLVDGVQVGAEDVAAPYSWSWDTTTIVNGSHTLTGRARDGAGNTTTSPPVTITVSNVVPPPNGLVGAWSFDEGSGPTVGDSSGIGNNGTVNATTWTPAGKYGKALSFNGSSSWVTIPDANSLDLTTGMTLEAWVNPTVVSGWQEALLKENGADLAYGLYANNGTPPMPAGVVVAGAAQRTASGTAAIGLNVWTHLATTYDGTTVRMFVNGVQTGTAALSGLINVSSGPLRIGGNAVWGEYFSGRIDEVRVYNRALSQTEIQTDMNTSIGPATPPDTTPPAVSITAPAQGVTVAGTLKVGANATDAGGIAGVQFKLDGANLGPEDVAAPYELDWNTGAIANANHTLTAVARDGAGNVTTSAPITVTVNNPTDVASIGQWSAPFNIGFVAVNMVLMNTGKVLMYPGWLNAGPMASVFDPANNTLLSTPNTTSNIFCSGTSTLADGRIMVAGGHDQVNGIIGLQHGNLFNPATQTWTRLPDMAFRRWYPTSTTLPDGRILVTSGATTCETCIATVPEVYNPVSNTWTQLTSAALSIPYYPFAFVLPNGKVIDTGSSDTATFARTLDVATQTWTTVDPTIVDGSSAAMYLPGKILQSGTSSDPSFVLKPAVTSTFVLDMNQATPAWRQTAPMAYARSYNNLTILPDGTVMAFGGGTDTSGKNVATAVYAAERWSPTTETWTTMASAAVPRLYHSTSLLLPDGRVLVAGGGDVSGASDFTQGEYYSPPYLFKGARPTVTSSPAELTLGAQFFVGTPDGASIASVALIRTGAPTHQFDENQRFLPLTFTQTGGGLNVTAPANANLAPPGHYMLFIVNTNGVPSIAPMVRFAAPYEDNQPPTAPTGLTANGGLGTATLSWTAATDNLGVVGYNVHRSTTSGFTPSPANRVGQPAGTSFTDTGVPAGTYYYVVVARDAAGNTGPASNQASATVTTDSTPPTVSMTAPAAGTVSGTVTVSANASDNVGVAGVQFLLDGAPLLTEDTAAPYSIAWDSRTATNATHTLSARARDTSGNLTTSTTVTVTVNNVAPAGLIAAYSFEEGAGTTTADIAGKGHVGTLSNATWTTAGKNGKALSFNGTNAFVSSPDANDLDLTNGMTLEAWVNPSALSGWNTVIMKEGTATTLAYSLYANDGSPVPSLTVRISNNDREAVGSSPVPLGTWTHLAATYDGTTMRLYVNGVQVGSRAQTGNMLVSTRTLRIGGNSVWGEYFNGLIDDVRIYNRALTATELQTDMNTPVQ